MRSLLALLLLTLVAPLVCAEPPIKPQGLKAGDTIMIVAPAGELNKGRVEGAKAALESLGFKVVMQENLFRARGYLAGTDEQRAAELMAAFTNPEVDAVFPGTGGYGTMRMMDLLDYDAIRANPKVFIGFSDVTGLHMALAAKANLVTFHSPNPEWGLGSDTGLPAFSSKYFWRNLLASENQGPAGFAYEAPEDDPIRSLRPGVARGVLCGGNLSLVSALVGTPYELRPEGKVLFLEDVNEAPYRVDRMLAQLKLAGQLDGLAGVVLGKFHKCDPDEKHQSLGLAEVFGDYFGEAPYPVIANFPAGHVKRNATLPFGCEAEINGDTATLRVLENPVAVEPGER
ncbi:MAG: S66 peptidase family protein [Lacipirellulaceae bacterium]